MKKQVNYDIIKNNEKKLNTLKIIRYVILTLVLVEVIVLTFLMTNNIVDLKGKVDKLETQIVELQGGK